MTVVLIHCHSDFTIPGIPFGIAYGSIDAVLPFLETCVRLCEAHHISPFQPNRRGILGNTRKTLQSEG
jgi:hypothetical protein